MNGRAGKHSGHQKYHRGNNQQTTKRKLGVGKITKDKRADREARHMTQQTNTTSIIALIEHKETWGSEGMPRVPENSYKVTGSKHTKITGRLGKHKGQNHRQTKEETYQA